MNIKKINKLAFTFVELIIVITIISILAAVGFGNYSSNISDTRNTARETNLLYIKGALQSQKQDKGRFPLPSKPFNIINSGTIVAKQGFMNYDTLVTEMDNIPSDPYKNNDYIYSITRQRDQMQVAATLEDFGEYGKAIVKGNYKTVSKNVLPTIILAKNETAGTNVEIHDGIGDGSDNRKLFIYTETTHNIPYDFDFLEPYSDDELTFDELLQEAIDNRVFLQDSNYRTCSGILEENKYISEGYLEEYFILENDVLTATGCTF